MRHILLIAAVLLAAAASLAEGRWGPRVLEAGRCSTFTFSGSDAGNSQPEINVPPGELNFTAEATNGTAVSVAFYLLRAGTKSADPASSGTLIATVTGTGATPAYVPTGHGWELDVDIDTDGDGGSVMVCSAGYSRRFQGIGDALVATTGSSIQDVIDRSNEGDLIWLPRSGGDQPIDFTIPIVLGGLTNATRSIAKSLKGYGNGFETTTPTQLGGTYLRWAGAADPSTTTVAAGSAAGTLVVSDTLTTPEVKHRWVTITSGAANGATRLIRSISGSTLSIEPNWATVPSAGDSYTITTRCALLIGGAIYGSFSEFLVDANAAADHAICYMGENAGSAPSFRNAFANVTGYDATVADWLVEGVDIGGADSVGINDQVDTTVFTNVTARKGPIGFLVNSTNAVANDFRGGACEDTTGVACFEWQRGGGSLEKMRFTAGTGQDAAIRIRELARDVRIRDNVIEVDEGDCIVTDTTDIDLSAGFSRFGFLTEIVGNKCAIGTDGEHALLYNHFGSLVLEGNQAGFRGAATSGNWVVQPDTVILGHMRLAAGGNEIASGFTQTWPVSRVSAWAPPLVNALPTAPQNGDLVVVTDDLSSGRCDSSGGTERSACLRVAGAWDSLIPEYAQQCYRRENLAAADDGIGVWMAEAPSTIVETACRCDGTCTTPATIAWQDRAGNAMTGAPTCSTGIGVSTWAAVTAAGALLPGEGLEFNVTNTPNPDATDEYELCWRWKID